MSDVCPVCGEENGRLARHWGSQRCKYPEFSDYQKEVVTGVLMSDGYINRRRGNRQPRLMVDSINTEYLEHLDDIFGAFSTGKPTCYRTAEEENSREKIETFKGSTSKDQYKWGSRSLPELSRWAEWYNSGEKVWPEELSLTPTVLKHLYAGDGSLHQQNEVVTIYLSNERGNEDKVNKYFTDEGLPKPKWYETERCDGSKNTRVYWSKSESKELLDYMGEPVKGHEYKWLTE
jgi:hypothetical protein